MFFITVGAGIDFTLAGEHIGMVLFWAAIVIAVKAMVLLVIARLAGIRRQMGWLFALSLAQAGEFAFVLISFSLGNGVLGRDQADMMLLVVALTMLATPLLFILYDKVIARAYCREEECDADRIEEENPIIIAGRGRVGGIVARMLQAAGFPITVIDYDSEHLELVRKLGYRTYFGDATRPDLLQSAGIARAKLLVVALDEREQIDRLVKYAIASFPDVHVLARAKDRNHVYELWSYGCRDVVRETYDSSLRMGRSAFVALGMDHQRAQAMTDAFEVMDRSSMREVAELYDPNIPAFRNEALLKRVRELRQQWDPVLRAQMEEIIQRGR